jgi:hypothetical protein
MAAPVSACQVLCEVADLIETKGWIQHTARSAAGYCLSGACDEVVNRKLSTPGKERDLLRELVVLHLTAAIKPGSNASTFHEVQTYNDTKGRTKEEAVAAARKAGTCPPAKR